MVSFSQIVKYLNISKGRKTIASENVDTRREKYDHIVSSRRINKLHKSIVIPAYTDPLWPGTPHNSIMAQFNFANASAFRLTNIELLRTENYGGATGKYLESCFLTVKYRESNVVYRYHLLGTRQEDNNGNLIVTLFPLYDGQIIGRYCVFELWQGIPPQGYNTTGILNDITLDTNLLIDPTTADDTEYLLTDPTAYDRASLVDPVAEGPFPVTTQSMVDQAYEDGTI